MNLKEIRKRNKLTQREVSKFLNITPQAYAHYEQGYRTPDINTLKKLAEFYHITLDELVNEDKKESFDNKKITILGYGIGKKEIELTEEQKQLLTSLIDQFEKSNKK